MLKLASWNVNSLKMRLDHVLSWLKEHNTHILALQETKMIDDAFPATIFTELGYHVCFSGQKKYNGVAIVSTQPLQDVIKGLPGFVDEQRRVIAVTVGDLRIINLYVPNGSHLGSDKYSYKLAWLDQTISFVRDELRKYPKLAVVGDFNIAPFDCDVHDINEWQNCVMVSEAERQAFMALLSLGLKDSFRQFNQEEKIFSWWDYRAGSFRRNRGLRIDHILLSHALAESCLASQIDLTPRKLQRPSDHAPVWVELAAASV